MKPQLTARQKRVLEFMDEFLKYAESGGVKPARLGLTSSQFGTFKTIARKKRAYPEEHKDLDIQDGWYQSVLIYQHQQAKTKPNQQQLSLREA